MLIIYFTLDDFKIIDKYYRILYIVHVGLLTVLGNLDYTFGGGYYGRNWQAFGRFLLLAAGVVGGESETPIKFQIVFRAISDFCPYAVFFLLIMFGHVLS
ncbi:hypothetical protein L596_028300 [Steinernema carpocapsae]|uniref:Uncharacterized protein n=1 Tax=Steinernema carpocapsae TaxID=34508 RepID=A0A4U5LY05_STECR|nr:hypothetical protein L596_028300 [Steinernema carpocapsae]